MNKAVLSLVGALALVGSTGCLPTYEPGTPQIKTQEPGGPVASNQQTSSEPVAVRPVTAADQASTWLDQGDPTLLAQAQTDQGPLEVASRRHSCMKMKYDTLGNLLLGRGVNLRDNGGNPLVPVTLGTNCMTFASGNVSKVAQAARYVYCDSRLTLGLPQYEGRLAEATSPTTASATKLLDMFVTAAPEIVANLGSAAACKVNGQAAVLFNADNTCNESGITCLQGYPATADQVALCSRLVQQADITPANASFGTPQVSALETGKRLAVATILTAAHACE